MKKTDRYHVVTSWNGIKWLFPKESHYSEVNCESFMTVKELVDIDSGKVPSRWRRKRH